MNIHFTYYKIHYKYRTIKPSKINAFKKKKIIKPYEKGMTFYI